jgi:hypothetical protein
MTIVIVGTVLLALIHDPSGTAKLVAITTSVRGITWITKKVTEQISLDSSQIIDFTGWSMAGISMVKIIGNAMSSIGKVNMFLVGVSENFTKAAEFIDKLTFWN